METSGGRGQGRNIARRVGSAKTRDRQRSRHREIQERIPGRNIFGRDLDLFVVAVFGCGLLRSEGERLSPARAYAACRASAQSSRVVPRQPGIRVRDLLQAEKLEALLLRV